MVVRILLVQWLRSSRAPLPCTPAWFKADFEGWLDEALAGAAETEWSEGPGDQGLASVTRSIGRMSA